MCFFLFFSIEAIVIIGTAGFIQGKIFCFLPISEINDRSIYLEFKAHHVAVDRKERAIFMSRRLKQEK